MEVSTLPNVIIFSVLVYLRCVLHHFLSIIAYTFRENLDFVFIIISQFMISAESRICLGLQIILVCLNITPSHYHRCANLLEDIELIKYLSGILFRVCNIRHILSIIHYTIYGAVCFQFTHFPCGDWEITYTLSYYHHQIGSMNYYPLFMVTSWNNVMRCILYTLLNMSNICYIWSIRVAELPVTLVGLVISIKRQCEYMISKKFEVCRWSSVLKRSIFKSHRK